MYGCIGRFRRGLGGLQVATGIEGDKDPGTLDKGSLAWYIYREHDDEQQPRTPQKHNDTSESDRVLLLRQRR